MVVTGSTPAGPGGPRPHGACTLAPLTQGKSGGHGVGWSEIPAYKFKVPATWEERPVSIADLGGTEVRR